MELIIVLKFQPFLSCLTLIHDTIQLVSLWQSQSLSLAWLTTYGSLSTQWSRRDFNEPVIVFGYYSLLFTRTGLNCRKQWNSLIYYYSTLNHSVYITNNRQYQLNSECLITSYWMSIWNCIEIRSIYVTSLIACVYIYIF